MKFAPYDLLVQRFGEPEAQNYQVAYDGEIETNDLERIFEKFDAGPPVPGYVGHSISVSDVIELYDGEGSEYYYVDSRQFKAVAFGAEEPEQAQMMQL